ncbi:class I SAM-dependent methyltransferase [Candidatus Nitrospira bockiana]
MKPEDVQEECYEWPYHWLINKDDGDGQHYYGGLELTLRLLQVEPGQRILDAGCGDGRIVYELTRKGCRVFGRDVSERAIAFAELLVPAADVKRGDLRSLEFPDNFFDRILLFGVLEHLPVPDMKNVLRELQRVARPGGRIAVLVPSTVVPVSPKHYCHFTATTLSELLDPFFSVLHVVGHHKKSVLYSALSRIFDNRLWLIKPLLAHAYKLLAQECKPERAVEIIALGEKR